MYVEATIAEVDIPEVRAVFDYYVMHTGEHYYSNDKTTYPYNPSSENMVTQNAYDTFFAHDITMNKSTSYVLQPISILDEEVPPQFPDSAKMEGIGQRTWRDYAPFHYDLDDGNVLIRCVHVKDGASSGYGIMWDELKIWKDFFGVILPKSIGHGMIPEPSVPEEP